MRKNEQFVFGEKNLAPLLRANPERSIAPEQTHNTADVQDGEIHLRTQLEPFDISVFLQLRTRKKHPSDLAELRRKLRGIFYSKEPKKLILPDDPDVYYMASVSDASELSNLWNTGSCTITFHVYDPKAYGRHLTHSLVAGLNEIHNEATAETYPVFNIRSTGGKVKVEHVTSGKYVELDATAASGSTVVINMDDEQATINTNRSAVTLASDFFPLEPGSNQIRVTNGSGTIEWSERWL